MKTVSPMRSKAPNTRPKTNVVVSYVPLPAVPTTPCCADDDEDIDEGELFPSPPSPPPLLPPPPLPSCDGRIANVAAVVVNIIPLSADATSVGVVVVGTVLMAELVVREVEGVVVGEEVVGVVVREGVVGGVVMVVMLLELRRAIVEVVRSTGTPTPPIPPASPTGSLEPSRWSVVARVVSLEASLRRSSISTRKKEREKKRRTARTKTIYTRVSTTHSTRQNHVPIRINGLVMFNVRRRQVSGGENLLPQRKIESYTYI